MNYRIYVTRPRIWRENLPCICIIRTFLAKAVYGDHSTSCMSLRGFFLLDDYKHHHLFHICGRVVHCLNMHRALFVTLRFKALCLPSKAKLLITWCFTRILSISKCYTLNRPFFTALPCWCLSYSREAMTAIHVLQNRRCKNRDVVGCLMSCMESPVI